MLTTTCLVALYWHFVPVVTQFCQYAPTNQQNKLYIATLANKTDIITYTYINDNKVVNTILLHTVIYYTNV